MELSVLISVGFCGWPNDSNVFLIGISVWELGKTPATSASAADSTTCRSVLHSTTIAPFLENISLVCGVFGR